MSLNSTSSSATVPAGAHTGSPGRGGAFEDLIVWQKAYTLALEVYRVSHSFPKNEIYGLTSQIQRAAVSVPANIAEGYLRRSRADKVRLLNIAEGSLSELQCHLMFARDLGYADTEPYISEARSVARMLHAYLRKVEPTSQVCEEQAQYAMEDCDRPLEELNEIDSNHGA